MVISVEGEKRKQRLEGELERVLPKIIELGAQKVILFGSLATGNVGRASDIDLIIVKDTDKRFMDRLDEFYVGLEPNVGMDILVYTPAEFEEMKVTSSLVRRAIREGKVLYEG